MKFVAAAALAAIAVAAAPPAFAQAENTVGLLASGAEVVGQDLGQAAVGGQSVFVYATGKAKLTPPPPPPGAAYTVQVSAIGATAVDAARQRDAQIDRMRAAAQAFSVTETVSQSAISLGVVNPFVPGMAPMPMPMPVRPAVSASGAEAKTPQFVAVAVAQFSRPSGDREAPFLDALHGAGAANISSGPQNGMAYGMVNTFLGVTLAREVDAKTWDEATRDAVRAARDQAATLADAAGRQLGEAREILQLTRGVEGDQATVTVAVRFAFAPTKP